MLLQMIKMSESADQNLEYLVEYFVHEAWLITNIFSILIKIF